MDDDKAEALIKRKTQITKITEQQECTRSKIAPALEILGNEMENLLVCDFARNLTTTPLHTYQINAMCNRAI